MDQINENFAAAQAFIENGKSFLLATHERTDGDDLGSMLAIADVLEQKGKKFILAAKGGIPASLEFLPRQNSVLSEINFPVKAPDFDAIILFGCSRKERTGSSELINSKIPLLNIDHHGDNQNYGTINLVDPKKSSVAELIYDFVKYLGVSLNPSIAKCLLTGIFTDTGSFMHSNTQSSTLAAAAELMKYGARIDKIFASAYTNQNLNVLKARAKAIENARVDKNNGVAISAITTLELSELGELPADAFGGIAETLNTIPGIKFSIFMRQEGGNIKGSMRSEEHKNVNVAAIAKVLGGGGHKLAAGFEMPGQIVKLPDGGWKIEK